LRFSKSFVSVHFLFLMDQKAVSELISSVAAEHALTLNGDFAQFKAETAPDAAAAAPAAGSAAPADDLEARLQALLSSE
jgi:hypothetical protein